MLMKYLIHTYVTKKNMYLEMINTPVNMIYDIKYTSEVIVFV